MTVVRPAATHRVKKARKNRLRMPQRRWTRSVLLLLVLAFIKLLDIHNKTYPVVPGLHNARLASRGGIVAGMSDGFFLPVNYVLHFFIQDMGVYAARADRTWYAGAFILGVTGLVFTIKWMFRMKFSFLPKSQLVVKAKH